MSSFPRRNRHFVAPLAFGSALAIALSGIVATTAIAAPVGDCAAGFTAGSQAEWLDGLEAAAACATADVTITLTDSFSLNADANLADPYDGTADLTVDGSGYTVTLAGASHFLYVPTGSPGAVHLRDLALDGTGFNYFVYLDGVAAVTLDNVSMTGSGIYGVFVTDASTLDMSNIDVTDSALSVAAIYATAVATITLTDSQVTSAAGTAFAGVIRLEGTTVTVTDSVFEDNSGSGGAGALYVVADDATILGSRFVGNSSASVGGAVHADGGSLTIGSSATGDSYFSGNTAVSPGGAVYSVATETTVTGATFVNNESVASVGGALFAEGLSIADSSFTDNTAEYPGGAVYSSETTVTRTTFVNNESTNSVGGAVHASGVTIVDSTFTDNTAQAPGGAVYSSSIDVTNSTFTNNQSTGSVGGAVFASGVTIVDSTFTDNTAQQPGGAVYSGVTSISGSTFSGNATTGASMPGGAVFANGVTTVDNSTFVNNTSTLYGGAIYAHPSLEVRHSTFLGNSATGEEGAHLYASTTLTAYASVFVQALGGGAPCLSASVVSDGYNFDDDGACTNAHAGTGDIDGNGVDPQLGALADNQGPTMTMLPAATSPLVDAIPEASCALAIAAVGNLGADQRGVERAQGDGCDIGAVEVIPDLTFTIAAASGPIEVTVTDALDYDCVTWDSATDYSPAPPAGVSFPHGIFGYCFLLPGEGWTITITLELPTPVNQLWKVTDGTWGEITDVTIDGTTVTYSVTDGGPLDDDGAVNGEILDPVGPGIDAIFTG